MFCLLTVLVMLISMGCNNKPKHSNENLSEFFLGIPVNCTYQDAENYVYKLYADSIIGSFKNLNSEEDSVSIISASGISYKTRHDLKIVGIDSVTNSFSIWANLIVNDQGKIEQHNVVTQLLFYNNNLLAVEIRPSFFSIINIESLLNMYKEKYGEPDIVTTTEIDNDKWDINGIYSSFTSEQPYIKWEKDYYAEEYIWPFKNAIIKLINLHYTNVTVNVSEYSYKKAEEILGKKYGAWDEYYLNSFLDQCTILNRESNKNSDVSILYINKKTLDRVNDDVKKRKQRIQNINNERIQKEALRDSITNANNKKNYLRQKI